MDGDETLPVRVIQLEAVVQGVVVGLLAGAGLCIATLWLWLKGGPVVGPHLALLGQFLVGYEVTPLGSLVGLGWGFVLGFAGGWTVSVLYNALVVWRRGVRS
jgi:hypothetical protein